MLIVSLIAVVGTLCWLVFTFAVYAVPAFVGMSAAMFAHQTGAGTPGAIVIGLLAGAAAMAFGQRLIASTGSPAFRFLVTALFAAPAGIAGFHAAHGIAAMGESDPTYRMLLALLGGVIVAATAWSRFGALARHCRDGASGGAWVANS